MAARRWRGPRRPDVQELMGSQSARAAPASSGEGEGGPDPVVPYRTLDDESLARARALARIHAGRENDAVPHFKYGFLSAGRADPNAAAATIDATGRAVGSLGLNQRTSIMDATRSFDRPSAGQQATTASAEEVRAHAVDQSRRERLAAGLGYGNTHPHHFAYLSKSLPPREVPPLLGDRPAAFPTVALPAAQETKRAAELEALPYEQQDEYSRAFKRRVASGLGFGPRKSTYFAYLANTYWRK